MLSVGLSGFCGARFVQNIYNIESTYDFRDVSSCALCSQWKLHCLLNCNYELVKTCGALDRSHTGRCVCLQIMAAGPGSQFAFADFNVDPNSTFGDMERFESNLL